jgi:hypothetical protein
LGASFGNGRAFDPRSWSPRLRGFVDNSALPFPTMADLTVLEASYPDVTGEEVRAFADAYSKIFTQVVHAAMAEHWGADWYAAAHRDGS